MSTSQAPASRRASLVPALPTIPAMQVHTSYRQDDLNPSGRFRTFANPLPIGFAAHGFGCLVYGSYCADFRNVSTPLLVSALCLGFSAPGCAITGVLAFIQNDAFFAAAFLAISGLWGFLGLAYLPVTGILAFYESSPVLGLALSDSIGIVLIWFGILATVLGLVIARRNVVFPACFLLAGTSLFVTAAGYLKHQNATSSLSKAGGYLMLISGLVAAYYIVASLLAAEKHWLQLPLGHIFDPHRLSDEERTMLFEREANARSVAHVSAFQSSGKEVQE